MCSPHQAKKVFDANLGISTALPCRISVDHELGLTKLATIKPTGLINLFGTPALKQVVREVETTLKAIMAEAVN